MAHIEFAPALQRRIPCPSLGRPRHDAYYLIYRHGLPISGDGEALAWGSATGAPWSSTNGGESWQHVSLDLPPICAVRFG